MDKKNKFHQNKKIIHDLRSHLGVVQAYVEVSRSLPKSPEENELFKNARTSLSEINHLLEQLSKATNPLQEKGEDSMSPVTLSENEKQVLIIDDDKKIREQFDEVFQSKKVPTIILKRGEELLENVIDLSKVSLAIVDFHFENSSLDGFDIIEYLQSQNVKKIHLCTGQYDDPQIQRQAKELGITSVIAKPLSKNIDILLTK